jgi:hypothetical protein
MAEHYKGIAEVLLLSWPVTASVFESVAEVHRSGATWHDQKLQKNSLDY